MPITTSFMERTVMYRVGVVLVSLCSSLRWASGGDLNGTRPETPLIREGDGFFESRSTANRSPPTRRQYG